MYKSEDLMAARAVLFDLDGTLVDTNRLIIESYKHTFKTKLGLDVPSETIIANFGLPLVKTFAPYARDAAHADELVAEYRSFNEAQHDALIQRVPGMMEAVQALVAAGIKIAVVTSKREQTARLGLKWAGLEPFFPVVVTCDTPGLAAHKPAADPALLALALLFGDAADSAKPHTWMVGDSALDILCGHAAGTRTAAVEWTALDRATVDAAKPTRWVRTPQELVDLVLAAAR